MSKGHQLEISQSEKKALAGVSALQRGKATIQEAADILGVSRTTIVYKFEKGTLKGIKVGAHTYIDLKSLVENGASLPQHLYNSMDIWEPDSNEDSIGDYYA